MSSGEATLKLRVFINFYETLFRTVIIRSSKRVVMQAAGLSAEEEQEKKREKEDNIHKKKVKGYLSVREEYICELVWKM